MSSKAAAGVRRQSLIDATAACLADAGAAGTSVRSICGRAGVSPGLLTHYFSGVDALIAETYRATTGQVSQVLTAAMEAAGDEPRARLFAFITANFRPPIVDRSLLATWLAFWSLVKTNPEIAVIHRQTYRDYRADLERLLLGCGCRAEDAGPFAIALTALVDGLWLELSLDPTTFSPEQANAMAVGWLDALLERPHPI